MHVAPRRPKPACQTDENFFIHDLAKYLESGIFQISKGDRHSTRSKQQPDYKRIAKINLICSYFNSSYASSNALAASATINGISSYVSASVTSPGHIGQVTALGSDRTAISFDRSVLLVHFPVPHHKNHILHRLDLFERVVTDGDDVGPETGFDRAAIVVNAEYFGRMCR